MFRLLYCDSILDNVEAFKLYITRPTSNHLCKPKKFMLHSELSVEAQASLEAAGKILAEILRMKYMTSTITKRTCLVHNCAARTEVEANGEAWTNFVSPQWVEKVVFEMPQYPQGSVECVVWKNILINEYGRSGNDTPYRVCKVTHIEAFIRSLALLYIQDTRITDKTLKIVEFDLLSDEILGDGTTYVKRVLRKGRSFKVNDPVAFNCVFREIQRSHPTYPKKGNMHGTKGVTEIFDMIGLGPSEDAHAHKVYLKKYRGDPTTDPDKIHPDSAYYKFKYPGQSNMQPAAGLLARQTDGLYFKQYVYSDERRIKSATQTKGKEMVLTDEAKLLKDRKMKEKDEKINLRMEKPFPKRKNNELFFDETKLPDKEFHGRPTKLGRI